MYVLGPSNNPPTGMELATNLKWFSNTLLNVLKVNLKFIKNINKVICSEINLLINFKFKDVPGQPFIMMRDKETDPDRMALYPSLDYKVIKFTPLYTVETG